MLYPELFRQFEAVRWDMQSDVPWDAFDGSKLSDEQARTVKMNAITEWAALPATEMFLHIGASTDQASEAVAAEVVRIVALFVRTGRPAGTVNLCAHSPARFRLVVRHLNRVGVLAVMLTSIREEGINVEEVENTIFAGAQAACCAMELDQPPSPQLLATLRSHPDILGVMLNARS